jgi:hypothetical protein
MKNSRSTDSVLDTLNWIKSNFFIPVALKYRTKHVFHKETFQSNYTPSDEIWQNNRLNIGVLTGPKRKGPIDVDLDCIEACKLSYHFLPHTGAVFGRQSKPSSHYLYKINFPSDDFQTIIYRDPSDAANLQGRSPLLFELRGNNSQTMMPGSIHDRGETIKWTFTKHNIEQISYDELLKSCKLLAAACLAVRYMWLDGIRHETTMQLAGIFSQLNKPIEECEQFIKALISYSGANDPAHMATIKTTYTRSAQDKAKKAAFSLRGRFSTSNPQMIKTFFELMGLEENIWLEELNEKYACVLLSEKYRVAILPSQPNEELKFISTEDFKKYLEGDYVPFKRWDKKSDSFITVRKPRADAWLSHPNRLKFEKVEFLPKSLSETAPINEKILNKFTGWPRIPLNNPSRCAAFLQYTQHLTGNNSEYSQWIMTYFANILQSPMDKQRAALVLIGPQNIGKSVYVNYFGKILGRHHLNIADAYKIHGRFNAHLETCLLLHSDEAIYSGDKKHKSIIKDLIANKQLTFEAKYQGIWSAPSYIRLIYTSNDDNAAPVELGDTRHSIFSMKNNPPSKALVKALYEESMSDGPAALMHYLLNYQCDASILLNSLNNKTKVEAVMSSLDTVDEYWLNKLNEGILLPFYLRWAQGTKKDTLDEKFSQLWPSQISKYALYADYQHYSLSMRVTRPQSPFAFLRKLGNWTNIILDIHTLSYTNPFSGDLSKPSWVRELNSGQHPSIINLPSLTKCREAFSKYTGQNYVWPEIEEMSEDQSVNDDTSPQY